LPCKCNLQRYTVLALHLKRFKYIESLGRYKKLMHRWGLYKL
jgi:hypothetical protein